MAKQPIKEYVAYKGKEFTIEWFYDENGYSQAREYAEALNNADQRKLSQLFMTLADMGQIHNKQKFRYEGDKTYAFKPKPYRFLCFFYTGRKVIVTNAFVKKQDKLPPPEKEKALKCMKDYEQRVKAGTYYA